MNWIAGAAQRDAGQYPVAISDVATMLIGLHNDGDQNWNHSYDE
jgi:hypothetical protein